MKIVYHQTLPAIKGYFKPADIKDALALLRQYGEKASVIAGGTDLVVLMRSRKVIPSYLIDISQIQELSQVQWDGNSLIIGACLTLRNAELSTLIKDNFIALYEALNQMASIQIRNQGTIGGNICRASPSADTVPPLIIYNAAIELEDSEGKTNLPLTDFFISPGKTKIKPGQMLTRIIIQGVNTCTGASFQRIARVAADLAKVNTAVLITVENNTCTDARIAIGSAGPTVLRANNAEAFLKGKYIDDSAIQTAGEIASQEIKPVDDARSTREYRKHICKYLVMEAIKTSLHRIMSKGSCNT